MKETYPACCSGKGASIKDLCHFYPGAQAVDSCPRLENAVA